MIFTNICTKDAFSGHKAAEERLYNEYKEHGKLIFCVDYDDTLYDYHKKGRTYQNLIELLKMWEGRSDVIVFTGNGEEKYPEMEAYLNEIGVKHIGINCQSVVPVKGQKIYANVYIDDRAGLGETLMILENVLERIYIEEGKFAEYIDIAYNAHLATLDAVAIKDECVRWIRQWFERNGRDCNAIIGISGGKDSSVVAALCVEALGNDRVIGVMMPNGEQSDIDDSYDLVKHLGIRYCVVNIEDAYKGILDHIGNIKEPLAFDMTQYEVSEQTKINIAPRLRMTALYAVSQSNNGRVANTCNLSEDYVGYATRWGDSVGDFCPLANMTTDMVVAVGEALDLPDHLVHKTPSDGLCGKTDEDNLGVTYRDINKYIFCRNNIFPRNNKTTCGNEEADRIIDDKNAKNAFKMMPPSTFNPVLALAEYDFEF